MGLRTCLPSRAALTQDYDEGPDGRFCGQQKAADLVLQHALGIGAQQFAPYFHHEEPHNTYLALFLNAGWLGGAMFLASPPRSGTVCAVPCATRHSSQVFLLPMRPLPDTRSKRP